MLIYVYEQSAFFIGQKPKYCSVCWVVCPLSRSTHNKKTDMSPTKQHGKGAIVSALSRFIHPSEHINSKFPNPVHGHRLVGCFTLRQEVKKVNRKDQLCADDFIELHAVVKHWKVEVEGDPDLCFTARVNPQVEQEEEPTPLPQAVDELLNNQATTEELWRHCMG